MKRSGMEVALRRGGKAGTGKRQPRLLQTVDKVLAKSEIFYIYNRFSGIMELSERRCFL